MNHYDFEEPLASRNFTGTGRHQDPDFPTGPMAPTDYVGTWEMLNYRDALRGARSNDPHTIVLALRSAAHSTWSWSNRNRIEVLALRNPACPSAVAAFAMRYWDGMVSR